MRGRLTTGQVTIWLAGAVILAGVSAVPRDVGGAQQAEALQGTWQLVLVKYGKAKTLVPYDPQRRRIKLITATHTTWVDHDVRTKKVDGVTGGPYTVAGDTFTGKVEFASASMEKHIGKTHTFRFKVEGDRLYWSGVLSDGLPIEEVWRRPGAR